MDNKALPEMALCNECGGTTIHHTVASHRKEDWFAENVPGLPATDAREPDYLEVFSLLECQGCRSITLKHAATDLFIADEPTYHVYYYPPRFFRKPPSWLTRCGQADLIQLMTEVYGALAADHRRLAAMGLRAALDLVLTDTVGDKGAFTAKLDALMAAGVVGSQHRAELDAAVDIGHAAVHRAYAPTTDDLGKVADIVETVIRAAYVSKTEAESLRRSTPPRRR